MRKCAILAIGFLLAAFAAAQPKPGAAPAPAAPHSAALEQVLGQLDAAAAHFKTAQADFVSERYQKVVNDTDIQKGTRYFRRSGKDIHMAADISFPDRKYVLLTGSLVQVYQPKIDQVTQYDPGKNKEAIESFLVLGFGDSGHGLEKSYAVTLGGNEELDGVRTARLELVPKGEKARGMCSQITLWIDLQRGVSVQQKFLEPSGDYLLAKYSNIKLNQDLPAAAFKLKTTSKTKVVTP